MNADEHRLKTTNHARWRMPDFGRGLPRDPPATGLSEEEVLVPLSFALSEHPHQVAAGVQTERLGLAGQLHAGLLRGAVALYVVAGVAAGYQILPGRFA